MPVRELETALFNDEPALCVGDDLIQDLKRRAHTSDTRRFRLCLHQSQEELLQEMIIVHCRDNYSRPHLHPKTATSCMVIEGEISIYLFESDGSITEIIELGERQSGKPFSFRLAAGIWHMPVCRSDQVVFYEAATGPFRRDDINQWASWSPEESDEEGIESYLRSVGAR